MISGTTPSPANPSRKSSAFDRVTYANTAPVANSRHDATTKGIDHFFSLDVSPGTMNAHSWYMTTGSAMPSAMNPTIFSFTRKASIGLLNTRSHPAGGRTSGCAVT